MEQSLDTRCGYIALIGRPNVGKSTLLNRILGQKLSITSRRPQTTRHQVLGINTVGKNQFIYVDTPGIHKSAGKAINRAMNKAATSALKDVDVIVFLIDRTRWTDEDELVMQMIESQKMPVIIAINKTDRLEDKAALIPVIENIAKRMPSAEIIPMAALHGNNVDVLVDTVA